MHFERSRYAYTPVAIVDSFGHGLSRALGTVPTMLPFMGAGPPPEFLEHFAVNLVSNIWTPLVVFAGWSAFLAYKQRAIRAEGTCQMLSGLYIHAGAC